MESSARPDGDAEGRVLVVSAKRKGRRKGLALEQHQPGRGIKVEGDGLMHRPRKAQYRFHIKRKSCGDEKSRILKGGEEG